MRVDQGRRRHPFLPSRTPGFLVISPLRCILKEKYPWGRNVSHEFSSFSFGKNSTLAFVCAFTIGSSPKGSVAVLSFTSSWRLGPLPASPYRSLPTLKDCPFSRGVEVPSLFQGLPHSLHVALRFRPILRRDTFVSSLPSNCFRFVVVVGSDGASLFFSASPGVFYVFFYVVWVCCVQQ